ncbi:MAG: TatD family hydrolase, partial [Thermoguttaceae bacterium]|nr:TatD family hydrolase [Thermoguttaceae bacterium]
YERLAFDSPLSNKIVALGETGLDRYWDYAPIERQRDYLLRTLDLGLRAKLPVVIHSREANDDIMSILRDFYATVPKSSESNYGVVHSFCGTPEQADELVDLGFYLGFGGFVTYTSKKFAYLWDVVKKAPIDRILLETDCPFLTPHPLRGKLERNEPLTTIFVAKRLAELREVSTAEIVNQTTQNATRLFKLPALRETPID